MLVRSLNFFFFVLSVFGVWMEMEELLGLRSILDESLSIGFDVFPAIFATTLLLLAVSVIRSTTQSLRYIVMSRSGSSITRSASKYRDTLFKWVDLTALSGAACVFLGVSYADYRQSINEQQLYNTLSDPSCVFQLRELDVSLSFSGLPCDPSSPKSTESELIEVIGSEEARTFVHQLKAGDDLNSETTLRITVQRKFSTPQVTNSLKYGDLVVVITTENFGGSGWFSNADVYGFNPFTSRFTTLNQIQGGDRCNDGIFFGFSDWMSGVGLLRGVSRYATPFRILHPLDDTDWRRVSLAAAVLDYKSSIDQNSSESDVTSMDRFHSEKGILPELRPYVDIDNSASSCFGLVHVSSQLNKSSEGIDPQVLGITIFNDSPSSAMIEQRSKIGTCVLKYAVEQYRGSLVELKGLSFVPIDKWTQIIDRGYQICQS